MGANTDHIRMLKVERDYEFGSIAIREGSGEHVAVDAIIVLQGNKIVYKRYAN